LVSDIPAGDGKIANLFYSVELQNMHRWELKGPRREAIYVVKKTKKLHEGLKVLSSEMDQAESRLIP
jgi:hypothetical protein